MYQINNFTNNSNINVLDRNGPFTVVEHIKDISVEPEDAMEAYYCSKMNFRKRQLLCDVAKGKGITCQAGEMQWCVGDVTATTGVKGIGDFLGKAVKGTVTGESIIKPEYKGEGVLVLEPTYNHIMLVDVEKWGGAVVLDDGLFLACDSSLQ
ncbi:MAG: AIM24 family protein, partial [Oscillospiraceae bacterium]|nr:AIM24 family protein [Oscillospiraceae bacterium]